MKSFLEHPIGRIVDMYRKRELSPTDISKTCIGQVCRFGDEYEPWVVFDGDMLLRQAAEVEARMNAGGGIRLLEGMPVGVKDIFNTKDFPTQMGSPIWKGFTPGNDSRVVHNVKMQGGVIPGKTVTAEFAVHALGKTLNPHDISKNPGTSSSGSAVAVALGMVPAALGTQTAGSIVRPASFCGVYGCKPSFGLIPRTGILKTNDSLDSIGFFTVFYEDLRRVFDTIRVHGRDYPFSNAALSDKNRRHKPSGRPWKVVLARTHTWAHTSGYARNALCDWMDKLSRIPGIEVSEQEPPSCMEQAHDIHSSIYDKSLSHYFKEEFKRAELVSPVMNDIIRRGNGISIERYQKALKEQEDLQHAMDGFMAGFDIMISLSTAGEAPPREETEKPDPALMWTMTHLPVVSAPVFRSPAGLPFGAQVVSRRYNDYLLFEFLDFLLEREMIPKGPNPIASCVDKQGCGELMYR